MPEGPQGQKRPGDVIDAAIMVVTIATGEIIESEATEVDDGKGLATKALGAKGGRARAQKLTPGQRSEIAGKAAAKRWGKSLIRAEPPRPSQ